MNQHHHDSRAARPRRMEAPAQPCGTNANDAAWADILRLAARVALGLEPGILLRLRALRPAELIFQGTSPGDLRIYLDADLRALPRPGTEYLLPAGPIAVPALTWADALVVASAEVPRPVPPRRHRKAGQKS